MGEPKLQPENILTVKMPEVIDHHFLNALAAFEKSWVEDPARIVMVDFSATASISPNCYRNFVILARSLKAADKTLKSLNLDAKIQRQLKSDGILSLLNPQISESAKACGQPGAKSAVSISVELINPFISATVNTLKVQAQTDSLPGKPYLVKMDDKKYDPPIGVVGIITLSTSTFKGTIALALSEKVFLKIYENMFGEVHQSISGEMQDAAAELLNIIYGTAKTELARNPQFDLQPAIPTVLAGEKISLRQKTLEKLIILPFESDAGPFQMEIAIEGK